MYLIPPCLTLSNIRYITRVKWSNSGKGVAPYPTPRCSSYWKGSLLVALDYGCQLYFLLLFHHSWRRKKRCICDFPKSINTNWNANSSRNWTRVPTVKCISIEVIIFTNPSTREGYHTRSIFKRTLTGLNSEFSFS